MRYTIVQTAFIIIALCSCSDTRVEKKYQPDGKLRSITEMRGDRKNGREIIFDLKGDTVSFKTFRNDTLDGPFVIFYERNLPKEKTHYKRGKIDGQYSKYFDNGNIQEMATYSNGTHHGHYYQYFPHDNGKLLFDSYFVNVDGKSMKYYTKKYNVIGQMSVNERYLNVTQTKRNVNEFSVRYDIPEQYRSKYDSAHVVSGQFDETFRSLSKPDTLTILPSKGEVSNSIDVSNWKVDFLRGSVVVYGSEHRSDTIIQYQSILYFEEPFKNSSSK